MKKLKKRIWLVPIIVLLISMLMPKIYSLYYSGITSSSASKVNFDHDMSNTYVRAYILTYWVDPNLCEDTSNLITCDIVAKSSWNINSNIINSDWVLINGYYYYSSSSNLIELGNVIPDDMALINPNLSASEISTDNLSSDQYIPQFKVIYEFLENYVTSDNIITTEDAWCVTFNDNIPKAVDNCNN